MDVKSISSSHNIQGQEGKVNVREGVGVNLEIPLIVVHSFECINNAKTPHHEVLDSSQTELVSV
jgi:hypothetical protein